MRLVVLGSGSTVPHPRRSSSAYWLETSGGPILLDCSASVQTRMAAARLDWPRLSAVWLSHFHLDHVGGFAPLLAATKHASAMQQRTEPLTIFGPIGTRRLIGRMSDVNNYRLLEQPFAVDVAEVGPLEVFEIAPGVDATALKTPHTPESLAIHIRDGDTTLVFTSDTAVDEALVTLAAGVDLLVLECTFVRDKPVEKHLELAEAMYIVRKARPRRALLTHFYPEWDDVDFAAEVAAFSPPCEVVEATDGLVINIDGPADRLA